MDHVLTLVAAQGELDGILLKRVRDALSDLGADTWPVQWLSPDQAADLRFALLAPDQATAAARSLLGGLPVDMAAQPVDGRRKRLLLADMDSTMVEGETLDDLAGRAGLAGDIAAVTAKAMRGEMDFAEAFRQRIARLAGLSRDAIDETARDLRLTPGAIPLVATMRANGARTVLVSGGLREFTGRAAALAGFDDDIGNHVEIRDGRLTGRVEEPVLDRNAKGRALSDIAASLGLPLSATLAVGDGANDLDMVSAAGLGVAFHGKPLLADRAPCRIDHGDLTALLYFQGYREDEFVAADGNR
ncbi:MAG: phosphoserine phosphatase SerB [Telmatospirillum sp.]|nr:phosphoserine phosphatase SerB [Telmatospirillum sp.]